MLVSSCLSCAMMHAPIVTAFTARNAEMNTPSRGILVATMGWSIFEEKKIRVIEFFRAVYARINSDPWGL